MTNEVQMYSVLQGNISQKILKPLKNPTTKKTTYNQVVIKNCSK